MAMLSDEYQKKWYDLQLEIAQSDKEIKEKTLEMQRQTMKKFLELVAKKVGRTGLISRKDLELELDISRPTIKRWEDTGLKTCIPPLEDTRTAFYKVADVLNYLGADE